MIPDFKMSILPIASIASLPKALSAFQQQFIQTWKATQPTQISAVKDLLPYCTVNPPLSEHARNVLSDICTGIPSLVQAVSTKEGQDSIRSYIDNSSPTGGGGDATTGIVEFWIQEYVYDS